jgi:hypothetical protein
VAQAVAEMVLEITLIPLTGKQMRLQTEAQAVAAVLTERAKHQVVAVQALLFFDTPAQFNILLAAQ